MSADAPTPDERRTRPFADVLRELDKGRVHTELSDKLQELLAAVLDVRKPGTLQLTVKVTPIKSESMVEVTASVAAKTPKAARTSVFFVTDSHNLSRDNPQQPALPLTGLPGGAADDTPRTERNAR